MKLLLGFIKMIRFFILTHTLLSSDDLFTSLIPGLTLHGEPPTNEAFGINSCLIFCLNTTFDFVFPF